MIVNQEPVEFKAGSFGSLAINKQEAARELQTMTEQSPAFLSETVPAAFRLDNPLTSLLVSNATRNIDDDYDMGYYPADDLGRFAGTEYEPELLMAKNQNHMMAMQADIDRELEDRETLQRGGGAWAARMAAGILSPEVLLPGGAVIKTARGVSVARSAAAGAAWVGGGLGISEAALHATQQTRTMEETGYTIAGGMVLGGLLGAGVSALSRGEFDKISKALQDDLSKPVDMTEKLADDFALKGNDLSAAAVEKLTMDDLTIKGRGAQFASRAVRIINPFNRLMNSPYQSAREMFVNMAEIPMQVGMNADGRTVGAAVETDIKLYNQGIARTVVALRDGYKGYKNAEKAAGTAPISQKEFGWRISHAMRNNDIDEFGNEFISKASREIRTAVFDKLLDDAIALKLFPEDVAPSFAASYLTRVWHSEKLVANQPAAMQMFREWAEKKTLTYADNIQQRIARIERDIAKAATDAKVAAKLESLQKELAKATDELRSIRNANDDGFSEYVEETAQEIYNKLTGIGRGQVPDFIAPVSRGPLKEKLLDITDNVAEPFLENDIMKIVNRYTQQMGSQVAFVRKFGSADMKDQFQKLDDEFMRAIAKAGDDPKLRQRLKKEYESNKRDLQKMRDIMRGTYIGNSDPDSFLSQAAVVVKDMQYMAMLGGVIISSLPDVFRNAMVHGMDRAYGDLLGKLSMPKELRMAHKADLYEMGFNMEAIINSRMSTLADIADPYARGSALTRATGHMSDKFGKLTGINVWNDLMKTWAATTTQNRVLKSLTGKEINAKDKAYLAYLGIDGPTGRVIAEQYAKHGDKSGPSFISGISKWDETPAAERAARIFKAALRKEADTIIVTKGVSDMPLLQHSPAGGLLLQFKSFLIASHQRVLMRGLSDGDANAMMGFLTMIAGGMVVAAIKKAERDAGAELSGRKKDQPIEDWSASKWLAEGLDRSGVLSIMWEANNIYEKAGGYGLTQMIGEPPASRFASRSILGAVAGPTGSTIESVASALGTANSALTGREVTKADVRAIRRTIPFQNLIGMRFLFDAVEGKTNEALGTK
jgi:hypothetical protein